MTLDFAILGSDGAPTQQVGIGTGVHRRLVSAAKVNGAQLTLRMNDYCADTDYAPAEVPLLLAELDMLMTSVKEDDELEKTLKDMRGIVERAVRTGLGIAVLAD